MATLPINLEILSAKLIFPYDLKKIARYKKIGYNMHILR